MLNIDLGLLKDQGGIFDRNTVAKRWLENTDAAVKKYFLLVMVDAITGIVTKI